MVLEGGLRSLGLGGMMFVRPRDFGGLGVRDLHLINLALFDMEEMVALERFRGLERYYVI